MHYRPMPGSMLGGKFSAMPGSMHYRPMLPRTTSTTLMILDFCMYNKFWSSPLTPERINKQKWSIKYVENTKSLFCLMWKFQPSHWSSPSLDQQSRQIWQFHLLTNFSRLRIPSGFLHNVGENKGNGKEQNPLSTWMQPHMVKPFAIWYILHCPHLR